MICRLAAAGLLALALGGCAASSPGRTNDEPKPPPATAAPGPPKAEQPLEPRVAANSKDEDVTDRVVAVVNNDAITLVGLQGPFTNTRSRPRQKHRVPDGFLNRFLTTMT